MSRATVGTATLLFVGLMGALPGYAQNRPSRFDTKLTPPGPHEIIFKGGPYSDKLLVDKYLVPFREEAFRRTAPDPLPMDAADVLSEMHGEIIQIQKKADEEKRRQREQTISRLTELQEKYTRESKPDKAERIQSEIRRLKFADHLVYPDPGSMLPFRKQLGKTLFFEVAGSMEGVVQGTGIYTGDSPLAAAAVHAGILKPGEKGIVKVTILESPAEHKGSTQFGVTSGTAGRCDFSYFVEAVREAPAKPE